MEQFEDFDDLTPSTITLVSKLTHPIRVKEAFANVDVLGEITLSEENNIQRNKKLKFPLVEEEGILSIRLKDSPRVSEDDEREEDNGTVRFWDKKESWVCRGLTGNKPFSTSLAIDYSGSSKNFSVKVFPGGKLQICGCRSYEEAYELIIRILDQLKKADAIDEDADIEWLDPQTINYRFELGFDVDFRRLSEILKSYGLSPGYDDLLSNKVEILLPSSHSKDHLKSRKQSLQRISIYRSGKIVQGGPSLEELRNSYNQLTDILFKHSEDIRIIDKQLEKLMDQYEEAILALFEDDEMVLTPKEIGSAVGISLRKTVNSILHRMVCDKKLTRIEDERGANPRFKLREKDVAKRVETTNDAGNRFKITEDEIMEYMEKKKPMRARDIANALVGNDLKSSITATNSVLYTMEGKNLVIRKKVKDDDPLWSLV